jgi:Uma2 family endonuclease
MVKRRAGGGLRVSLWLQLVSRSLVLEHSSMVAQFDKPIVPTAEPPQSKPQRYSLEEYLAIEVEAEEKHEFRDGEIIPMAGGLPNHNRITLNLGGFLNFASMGNPYQVFVADQRVWIPEKRLYTYPDVLVVSGELELQAGRKDTIVNPLLVIEVLSKSTADYDRGDKFAAYRSVPGFREYLLVSQYGQEIEHYVRGEGRKWDFQVYDKTDRVVHLETIDLELSIVDIYDKVEFEVEEIEAE